MPTRSERSANHTRPKAPAPPSIDAVVRKLRERGVRNVKIGGFDLDGVLRGKYVSLEKFISAAESGLGFCDVIFGWDVTDVLYDNAKVTGWHTGYPDVHATLDLSTLRFLPWEPGTAAFLLDFWSPDHTPHPASPRQLLQQVVSRAAKAGFQALFSAEFEFFVFRETADSLRLKGFTQLSPLSPGMFGYSWLRTSSNADWVHGILDGCRDLDVEIEGMHTETGPGVYECAIRYDHVLAAADKAALFKTAVKEISARHGVIPTFMAKWNERLPGCSGHLHQSLLDKSGKPVFASPGSSKDLPNALRWYLGGLMKLMPGLSAIHWPTLNSYKRSVENTWAPTTATWGVENRTTAVRVIPGSAKSQRIEYRQTGADINPYLSMAANLAAGLWGIQHQVEPPTGVQGNGYADRKATPLPRNLADATALLAKSRVAREILGDGFVDHYVSSRQWEVRQFERAVTTWELERYFEAI